ncbi:transmembrane protein 132D isoform X2 [Esox lucius]|nr:transmembrane protein 132D isoform X2 [Esox lucius]XP_034152123.1 transmembrane protein 132D isoform X2 [Esox lucius]XP_034152124.1 transmembrane protein 132D isoform X2 [Esox lucius]
MSDNTKSSLPLPVFLPVSYQVVDTDYFFLKEAGQDFMRNFSMQTQTQPFVILGARRPPAVNASYGPLSTQQPVPLDLVQSVQLFRAPGVFTYNWKVQSFVLTPRVYSTMPVVRVLFYVAGREWDRGADGLTDELPCITVFAFWQTQEVRGSCALGGQRGTCMAELEPVAGWFSPAAESSSRERLDQTEGNTVELYYQARPSAYGQCMDRSGSRWGSSEQPRQADYIHVTPMQRIGSVRLLKVPNGAVSLSQLKLGKAVVIQTSSKPLKKTDIATFYILMTSSSSLENFTLRATVRQGVLFRTATPSNSLLWDITLDTGVDSTIAVICQRKVPIYGKRTDSSLLEVLQMDFEVEELGSQLDSQVITWHLESPPDIRDVGNEEGSMRIYTIQRDFVGLAPLVMDSEILNTAVLTGNKVVLPVRTVAVEADGSVTDVSDFTDCSSTDEDILKVSDRCDYVFVNGKEMKGKLRMMVNFTYSYLSAQLEMNVWIPRLPLQIEVSDTELSQIRGWRVPIVSTKSWNSEDEEDKKGRGCMLQFQHALVRVVTHFIAEQSDPREPQAYLLGSDWQVDVTRLVRYFLKVDDPRIARLQAGTVLSGRDVGTTSIQVLSPLSDSILAEKTVTVVDDKVTITELGVQLVTGLALSLKLSPGSNRAILATTTTQEVLQSPKQEAVVSSWVQFSDGAMTPLDIYDPTCYRLTVTSLDEGVVSVRGSPPMVQAQGEGQGVLIRVEMSICEACQKSKRKSTMAVGSGSLKVKFQVNSRRFSSNNSISGGGGVGSKSSKDGSSDYGNDGEEVDSERKQQQTMSSSSASEREESAVRKVTTTAKSAERESAPGSVSSDGSIQVAEGGVSESGNSLNAGTLNSPAGPINSSDVSSPSDYVRTEGTDNGLVEDMGSIVFSSTVKAPGNLVNYKNIPSEEVPGQEPVEMDMGSEDVLSNRPFSDLEIGMYALLGVFCVAILVFLGNCISYVVKFRHKEPPSYGQEPTGHRHDWVWLGTDAELVMNVPGSPIQQESHNATTVIDIGPDKTASLPRRSSCLTSSSPSSLPGCAGSLRSKPINRTESLHSPTSKRKRVQFTTFASLDRQPSPHLPREKGHGIHWVGKEENNAGPQVPITEPVERL